MIGRSKQKIKDTRIKWARKASMIHTSCEEFIELKLEVSEPEKCEEAVP